MLFDYFEHRADPRATINHFGHSAAYLVKVKNNTELALGKIRAADYANGASTILLLPILLAGLLVSVLKR